MRSWYEIERCLLIRSLDVFFRARECFFSAADHAATEARKGRLNLPKGRKVTLGFREAAEKYLIKLEKEGGKDLKKKEQRLRLHLSPFFKDKPLSSIAAFDLERFKKSRKEEGVTNGTINRELAALSHLFSKAVEWKWIDRRPAKINRLKEDGGRMVYLTAADGTLAPLSPALFYDSRLGKRGMTASCAVFSEFISS